MIVFDRPNAAFRRHQEWLRSLKLELPPTDHPVPTLWERAKTLLGALVGSVGSALGLAERKRLPRKERGALLRRLEPVEKLVRTLLLVDAINWLLMTPEGARLRREAKPAIAPEPPAPERPGQAQRRKTATLAERYNRALQTIACLRPRIDPRAEALKARARAEREAQISAEDRALARCRFGVIGWTCETPILSDTPPRPRGGPWIDGASDDDPPARLSDRAPRADAADNPYAGPALGLARRIAALMRVIANPQPAIRRLAARLATLDRDLFPAPRPQRRFDRFWRDGRPEYLNAMAHLARAHRALYGAPRPPDPG